MIRVESPAKLNLSLLVSPPRADGYHPLDSIAQTIEWCDILDLSRSEDGGSDSFVVVGADLDHEENLVTRALQALREVKKVPPLDIRLEKSLPILAGLGGGSSNAAAALIGAGSGVGQQILDDLARRLGSDVPLFLRGGTQRMQGVGDQLEPWAQLGGFAVAVAVPEFGLETAAVYQRWDRLEGPEGEVIPPNRVPPQLREFPLRNDLLPAALDLEPQLGDFLADLRSAWGVPVSMTGSGSACFGYFSTVDEAESAASEVSGMVRLARGVDLRDRGATLIPGDHQDG